MTQNNDIEQRLADILEDCRRYKHRDYAATANDVSEDTIEMKQVKAIRADGWVHISELDIDGALENGRICIERLENIYEFSCVAGPLALCEEWLTLTRCFNHIEAIKQKVGG